MTPAVTGGLLGFGLGVGALLVAGGIPPARRITLDDRLAPYLRETLEPSRLLGTATTDPLLPEVLGKLAGPSVDRLVRMLGPLVGGGSALQRRLNALGTGRSAEEFRRLQAEAALLGLGVGLLAAIVIAGAEGAVDPTSWVLLCASGGGVGLLLPDWLLTARVGRRRRTILAEFPVVAELLAIAVMAGETPAAALERVHRLVRGEIARELGAVLDRTRSGVPLAVALEGMRDAVGLDALARFVDGLLVAIDRGTPLAEVLRAQAADVREAGKRELIESGGRKEILMMIPVVFLVLPLTVLFALYPGLVTITQVAP